MTQHTTTDEDVLYFQQKLARALGTNAEHSARKQLEMIEDSVVIYHLTQPQRTEDGTT